MPARNFRSPVAVVGAPPADTVSAALSLLSFLGTMKGRKATEAVLRSLEAAIAANTEALSGFGGAAHIVELEAEVEADRERARDELDRARVEAKRLVSEAGDRVAAGQAELADQRRQLDRRAADLTAAEQGLAERQAAFGRETAGLRAALAG